MIRPLLAPPASLEEKTQLEFAALRRVAAHFEEAADERFAWVRPLDWLPAMRALVVEERAGATLRYLLRFGSATSDRTRRAIESAGAWLRLYHAIEADGARDRLIDSPRAAAHIASVGTYLAGHLNEVSGLVEEINQAVSDAADRYPRDTRPVLGHGDFAPRNILVTSEEQIAVIDTLARWRIVPYEDLAYFLVSLDTGAIRLLRSLTPWRPRSTERNLFLRGYYGDAEPPVGTIAVYELAALMDRWAATIRRRRVRRLTHPAVVTRALDAAYRRHVELRLRLLERAI